MSLQSVNQLPPLEDLRVFVSAARLMSFSKAAEQLSASPAYISKRVKLLEDNLGIPLFTRLARSVRLTPEGIIVERYANNILQQIDAMKADLRQQRSEVKGNMRISCSSGFGSEYLDPCILLLREKYPQLSIELLFIDEPVDLLGSNIDLDVCIGHVSSDKLYVKKLADNYRVLCASPSYLQKRGEPATPEELKGHDCIMIRERNQQSLHWNITAGKREITVTPNTHLTVNNGKVAKKWCLEDQGIMLRSLWDVQKEFNNGTLIRVLPDWYQQANIHVQYHQRSDLNPNIRVFIEHLQDYLANHPDRT